MRAAVIGHVEWVTFARVSHVPRPGEILFARSAWEEPGGGGANAAVEMARLAGRATIFTGLGNDDRAAESKRILESLGVEVRGAPREVRQPRVFTWLDDGGERTITVTAAPLAARGEEPLGWDDLDATEAVVFTKGDAAALQRGRRARVLVAPARIKSVIAQARILLDVLILSAADRDETYRAGEIDPAPRYVITTQGGRGGHWLETATGTTGRWDAVSLPGPRADAYGAGDCFMAGLAIGLGEGRPLADALGLAAKSGALALTRPGANGITAGPIVAE